MGEVVRRDELVSLISSTGLLAKALTGDEPCPRALIGLDCLAPQFACLCALVTDAQMTLEADQGGTPRRVTLNLTTQNPSQVIDALHLTGLGVRVTAASNKEVVASFDLMARDNDRLRQTLSKAH